MGESVESKENSLTQAKSMLTAVTKRKIDWINSKFRKCRIRKRCAGTQDYSELMQPSSCDAIIENNVK